tara:strand:- start:4257 stop:5561 length:1305 start_codon:yes stop_codon:yes gene_type:complete
MAMPKTKRKKARAAPRIQRGSKLKEPTWDGWEEWTGEAIHRHRRYVHSWYYEHFKSADLYTNVPKWMEKDGSYTKDEIRCVKVAPNSILSITGGIVARMDIQGAPRLNEKEAEHWISLPGTGGDLKCGVDSFLRKKIKAAITEGSKVVEEKAEEEKELQKVGARPELTIQDRILLQAQEACEAIDLWLDGYMESVDDFKLDSLDISTHFITHKVSQAHARKIKDMYSLELQEIVAWHNIPTAGQLKKLSEHDADMWEQLREGYSHRSKKQMATLLKAYEKIMSSCDMVVESAKVTRKPRKTKIYSAEKLVQKLKFKIKDEKYSLVSINPADIIYASELWVFNIKTRKLGKYVADAPDPLKAQRPGSGLQVKGTTITGFIEEESIQKTMRKPEEQLKEFKKAGKVALRKFMEDIKTTDTKLNGRINAETILLKVT